MSRQQGCSRFVALGGGLMWILLLLPIVASAQGAGTGEVIVRTSGPAQDGVRVCLFDVDGQQIAESFADFRGACAFSGITPGAYLAVARAAPGTTPGLDEAFASESFIAAGRVVVDIEASDEPVELSLSNGAVVSGRVTETQSGMPIPNVPVSAYRSEDSHWTATALSWADGTYFLVLPEGRYVLDARRPAGKLYEAATYNGLAGTVSEGDNFALATRVTLGTNEIIFDKDFQIARGTITVLSPNGGETWTAGSTETIRWATSAVPPNAGAIVLILDQTDGTGASPLTSVAIPAEHGEYTFEVPTWLADGGNYVVELWLAQDNLLSAEVDQSDAPFTITGSTGPRKLSIISPAPNQSCWTAGTDQTLSWTLTPAERGCIQSVLLDSGRIIALPEMASSLTGAATWHVPYNIGDGTGYRLLSVYLTSTPGPAGPFLPVALSAEFEICGSATRPSLSTTLPYAGQTWTAGTYENICWETDEPTGYVSSALIRNGVDVNAIGLFPSESATMGCIGSQICSTVADSDDYRIVSVLQTPGGLIVSDETDGDFRITGGHGITLNLTSPDGGESLSVGDYWPITWEPVNGNGRVVNISLATATGEWVAYLGNADPEAGVFDWDVSSCIPDIGPAYVITLSLSHEEGCPDVRDGSRQPFTITGGQPRTLMLTSFNDGESYTGGQTYPITWYPENAEGKMVDIRLYQRSDDCSPQLLVDHLGRIPAEVGRFDWTICPQFETGSNYALQLAINEDGCPTVWDGSEMPFTINGLQAKPTLELTWPTRGETLVAGSTCMITWDHDNAGTGMLNLDLETGDGEHALHIGEAPVAAGVFDWTICSHIGDRNDYELVIGIYDDVCPAIVSRSGTISIVGSRPVPTLEILSPVAGDTWIHGEPNTILWETNADPECSVDITLIPDAGVFLHLATVPANEGQHVHISCPYRNDNDESYVELSLECPGCSTIVAMSDPFQRIQAEPLPSVQLISPQGGEVVSAGGDIDIEWQTDATQGQTCIDILKSGIEYWGVGCFPTGQTSVTYHLSAMTEPGSDYTVVASHERERCGSFVIRDESAPFEITQASISGTVRDGQGNPLGGIIVELLTQPAGSGLISVAYAVTEYETGHYTIQGIPPGSYRLRAGAELPTEGAGPAIEEPTGQHWYERVDQDLDYDNARRLCISRGGDLAAITTQAENVWVWNNMASGRVLLGGTDRDNEGTWVWPGGEPWSYENWRDGEPNDWGHGEDYLVMAEPDGQWNDVRWFESGFLCEYEEPPSPTQNYARVYYPYTFYFNEADIIEVAPSAHLTGLDFILSPAATVCGTVTESDGVTPVPGAWIELWPCQWQRGTEPGFHAHTDQAGHYTVRHLPAPNAYDMAVEADPFVPRCYDNRAPREGCECIAVPAPAEMCDVDFTLEPGGCISGAVRVDGQGQFGAAVGAFGKAFHVIRHSDTDENGEYSVCGLPADDYVVFVQPYAPDFPDRPYYGFEYYNDAVHVGEADLVHLPAGGGVTGINFDMNEAGCIRGRVFDEETGTALSGSPIGLFVRDGAGVHETALILWTDSSGSYTAIARPETYLVGAHRAGYVFEYYDSVYDPSQATPVEVTLGPCSDDIDIYLNPAHKIDGEVIDCDSEAGIAGATCHAFPLPAEPGLGSGAFTDPNGSFVIEGLPDHDYEVRCAAAGYCPAAAYVPIAGADRSGLVLELCPSAPVDFDGDCDVDLDDYATFISCASGPSVPSDAGCDNRDLDGDHDVDHDDFGIFQRCVSGEGNPPDPGCAD